MKLGIIGPMDIEVAPIKARIENPRTDVVAGIELVTGTLCGQDVILAQGGIGKTCAAACAQLLISSFGVTHLVVTGIAGSLDEALEIGDIVVGTACTYFDVDVTYYGYAKGQVPGFPADYPCDPVLSAALFEAAKQQEEGPAVYEGPIVTGDSFIESVAICKGIRSDFAATCCDMESAAVGQVAHMNGVPYAVVRSVSDKADGQTYDEADRLAANNAGNVVLGMVTGLA